MAVSNRRRESSYRAKVQIQDSPHFFKVVMLPPDQGLKIPDAFMRKYGCDLQDVALLKVPTGASWQIELVRNENHGALLMKGWERFAEFYCIEKLSFLVFKYEGNSQFQVLIFDQTALEIEYPVETNDDRSGRSDDVKHELEISATSLKTRASKGKGKRKRKRKRKRQREDNDDDSIEILLDDDDHDHDHGPSEYRPRTRSSMKELMIRKEQGKITIAAAKATHYTKSGKNRALKCSKSISNSNDCETILDKMAYKSYKKALSFTSSNPFFVSFMQPSYVSKTIALEIPIKFARRYLFGSKHGRYILKCGVSGERRRSWRVTVFRKLSTGARFSIGWRKFVKDNGLKVGNVCVFELMPGTSTVFNVTVY